MKAMPVTLRVKKTPFSGWGVAMEIGVQGFQVNPFGEEFIDGKVMMRCLKTALENAGCKVRVKND